LQRLKSQREGPQEGRKRLYFYGYNRKVGSFEREISATTRGKKEKKIDDVTRKYVMHLLSWVRRERRSDWGGGGRGKRKGYRTCKEKRLFQIRHNKKTGKEKT